MRRTTLQTYAMMSALLFCFGAAALDEPKRVPSLDELLGLPEPEESQDTRLIDEALSAQQAGEAFAQAVGLMGGVADRIAANSDTGLTTQRMQEEIIRKLQQVIDSAQQNQNSSGGSSSSSSSSSQQQPNQQSQQSNTQSQGSGEPSDGSTPPGSTDVGANNLSAAHARWGHLPERLRDALSQGLDEPYSQLYRRLTEQYYKTLAEDDQ
ncbi:MAG: hypothetical protein JKY43_09630 [Phycisphaerales bacterium]|nr:hypothetical protein [Phycisphaerales bacterium]